MLLGRNDDRVWLSVSFRFRMTWLCVSEAGPVEAARPRHHQGPVAGQSLQQSQRVHCQLWVEQKLDVVESHGVATIRSNQLVNQAGDRDRPLAPGQLEQPFGQAQVQIDDRPSLILGCFAKRGCLPRLRRTDDENQAMVQRGGVRGCCDNAVGKRRRHCCPMLAGRSQCPEGLEAGHTLQPAVTYLSTADPLVRLR